MGQGLFSKIRIYRKTSVRKEERKAVRQFTKMSDGFIQFSMENNVLASLESQRGDGTLTNNAGLFINLNLQRDF